MKKLLFYVLIAATITSCRAKNSNRSGTGSGDEYFTLNQPMIDSINRLIKGSNMATPEEVIQMLYPKQPQTEGRYSYQIRKEDNVNGEYLLTLFTEGIPDDSMYALKAMLTLKKKNNSWVVITAKETYNCWPGRGHEKWSPDACL